MPGPPHAQRLCQAAPDLEDWPRSRRVEPAESLMGRQIVQAVKPFMPFLLLLLDQGPAKAAKADIVTISELWAANSSAAVTTTTKAPKRLPRTPSHNSPETTVDG